MDDEFHAIEKNNMWALIDLLANTNLLKWNMCTRQYNPNLEIDRSKVRLVAKRYKQKT